MWVVEKFKTSEVGERYGKAREKLCCTCPDGSYERENDCCKVQVGHTTPE